MARLIAVLALAVFASCARCHEGHRHVVYHPAWTEVQHISTDAKGGTVLVTIYHPATCAVRWECDVYCRDMDLGRAEAHPKHAPIELRNLFAVDGECEATASSWRPRRAGVAGW